MPKSDTALMGEQTAWSEESGALSSLVFERDNLGADSSHRGAHRCLDYLGEPTTRRPVNVGARIDAPCDTSKAVGAARPAWVKRGRWPRVSTHNA